MAVPQVAFVPKEESQEVKTNNPKLDEAFNEIMDCFTGADGGVEFTNLKWFLEEFDKRAKSGDLAATKILEVVYQFHKLIKIANSK